MTGKSNKPPRIRKQANGGWLKSGIGATEWPVFDSAYECTAKTGIPKNHLKAWKAEGAPGFKGSRIYFGDLLPWIMNKLLSHEDKSSSGVGLPPVLTWDDVERKQKYEQRCEKLIDFERAMAIMRDGVLPIRQFLLAMPSSLGHRCNPSDPVFAQRAIEAHCKQGMRMIAEVERNKISENNIEGNEANEADDSTRD